MINTTNTSDGSQDYTPLPENLSQAIAYVVFQTGISGAYSPEEGLKRGTLFPSLYKPFTGKRGDLT